MFCIPGIARVEDVDMAAGFGMKFIRVGTNVSDVHQAKEFIEVAKKHDMFVGANFMKSYTMKPAEFAERARLAQQYGADVLYIVDSAGGMLQSDVDDYFHAVQDRCDIPLGFHGHNNLGLAVSHSLRAIELGATMVDCTLQGLGRSAGNAPTELMVMALSRMGMDLGIDPIKILDLGERCIRPLIKSRGLRSLDVVAGFAQFHSSYMGTIRRFSSKYRIDPRRLIIEVCRVNKVDAPADLVEETARRLSGAQDGVLTARFDFDEYFGDEQVGGKT
jgi:4-hydroxy-2-oxovalerate aldolase